ncbi:hypothetical protein EYC84_010248 [Monilinia fructicola]|nr:hypothetical protein EYC84_010248 [Monilinia fructicola]
MKEEVPKKNGIEIRGDDIRQATSMRLSDRSPKLPTPTAVSDRPGRPIVSFDKNWKPQEADDKPEVRRRSPFDRRPNSQKQSLPSRTGSTPNAPNKDSKSKPSVPTINFPDTPQISVSAPSVPTIIEPGSSPTKPAPVIPSINVPTINEPISQPTPQIPTISEPGSSQPKARPLPDPKTAPKHPNPRQAPTPLPRGHWSPAVGSRATATCHQCQLPIEGKVVALRGIPERFHPECFICFTCGTALQDLEISPEPAVSRAARLDRIKRRAQGEDIPDTEGETEAEDGDARLRFYCHLDWHELYAPRCKHCKTPIIGEHAVALGEHWHYGHFFCAECGDPFEQGMTHIEKDGYAWCLSCQTKRTERRAPKCKRCKKAVLDVVIVRVDLMMDKFFLARGETRGRRRGDCTLYRMHGEGIKAMKPWMTDACLIVICVSRLSFCTARLGFGLGGFCFSTCFLVTIELSSCERARRVNSK